MFKKRKHSASKKSFSMLEAAVVLLIMSILLLVSIPFFSRTGADLDDVCEKIVSYLKSARRQSMTEGKNYLVIADKATGMPHKIWMAEPQSWSMKIDEYRLPGTLDPGGFEVGIVISNIENFPPPSDHDGDPVSEDDWTGDVGLVTFTPTGNLLPGSVTGNYGSITISDSRSGASRTIYIVASSGAISFQEPYPVSP